MVPRHPLPGSDGAVWGVPRAVTLGLLQVAQWVLSPRVPEPLHCGVRAQDGQ